jgi:hypothetical protein
MRALALLSVLGAIACGPAHFPPGCSWTCFGNGIGATASHCGAERFSAPQCDAPPIRAAVEGETVEIRATRGVVYARVERSDLEGLIALERVAIHGDSGSGVFGADGALLGIVDRNQGAWTIAVPVR